MPGAVAAVPTKKEDLIDGIEVAGAATFLEYASQDAIVLAF